jgi:hypothetical protein
MHHPVDKIHSEPADKFLNSIKPLISDKRSLLSHWLEDRRARIVLGRGFSSSMYTTLEQAPNFTSSARFPTKKNLAKSAAVQQSQLTMRMRSRLCEQVA